MIFLTKHNFILFVLLSFTLIIVGCRPDEDKISLNIQFKNLVADQEVVYANDSIIYQNSSGISYSVRRVLYVLSDIKLFLNDGNELSLDDFFFINTDDISTLNRTIDNLSSECIGISFRLGFSSEENIDNNYINSPNNFHLSMLWPNLNGTNLAFQGGYHYMKLEGKFINDLFEETFYNTHTGPTNGEDFSILYPQFSFAPTSSIVINMNINNWYNNPVYDMVEFGSGIMGNVDAQSILYQNGLDVFTVQVQ